MAIFSVVVQDDNGLVQVFCEVLMAEEHHDAYKFMLNSAFEIAPSFNKIKLHAMFGDEFLTPYLFRSIDLAHVQFL